VSGVGNTKVGIIACSGEEMPEGTITRQAALEVLHELRPHRTVTICLPLFLAGGKDDRAFARLHPTITVDGCERRCAERATARFSGGATESVVVTELAEELDLPASSGVRRLDDAGRKTSEEVALHISGLVDELMSGDSGTEEVSADEGGLAATGTQSSVPCACGSSVPALEMEVGGRRLELTALPLVMEQYAEKGLKPSPDLAATLAREARVYNTLPDIDDEELGQALLDAYQRDYVRNARKDAPE